MIDFIFSVLESYPLMRRTMESIAAERSFFKNFLKVEAFQGLRFMPFGMVHNIPGTDRLSVAKAIDQNYCRKPTL